MLVLTIGRKETGFQAIIPPIDFSAVSRSEQRTGVGTAMINRLKGKLSRDRRNRIVFEVRESNIPAQLFFKSQGFHAIEVLKGHYEDCNEDAYRFQHEYRDCQSNNETQPTNRIARLMN